jgi:glutathione S-transferase
VTEDLGIDVHSRFVVPAHSERGHVKHVSGTRSVPVLIDEKNHVTMSESANIVEYIKATRGEGAA